VLNHPGVLSQKENPTCPKSFVILFVDIYPEIFGSKLVGGAGIGGCDFCFVIRDLQIENICNDSTNLASLIHHPSYRIF